MRGLIGILACAVLATWALAADDPRIKGEKRTAIQTAMQEHIDSNSVDGRYVLYDAVADDVLKLRLTRLHDGIVKKGDYYVSCADFLDSGGVEFDLDFLVIERDGGFQALQGVVHKADGVKRTYHLED